MKTFQQQDIYLLGMPGSGKTTLGKALAQTLNRSFLDLDSYIEEKESTTIPEIFANRGERAFRALETNYLYSIKDSRGQQVVATGGGTPCFNQNMDYILKNGISIYLEIPEEVLAQRLLHQADHRPLVKGKSEAQLLNYLSDLLIIRKPHYRRATLVFSGIEITADHIIESLQVL